MPPANSDEFFGLPFQEKLEFLYGLPARQKRDLILSVPEAERLVQSFSPDTLFYTLKEIGVADAGDLLSLALPEQVRWLFDLDCWEKDRPNLGRMREWIEALAEAGRKRMAEGLMALELELVALLMRRYIRVHRLDDPQALPEAPSERFIQFDEHYLIEFILHDVITPQIGEFLEECFERDYNYFAGLMEEIYWGVEAELEEQAYQFRNSRLADRGFPDYFEAQNVFAYLDPRRFIEVRRGYEPPERGGAAEDGSGLASDFAPVLAGADNSLFNAALTAGFAAQGKRQLHSEMAMVTNQALVASAVDFGDLDAVRVVVERTHSYLNLGLEHLAGGDLNNAIEHLRETHLKLLFRLGVSLTIDLRKRAETVVAKLGLTVGRQHDIPYLDSPWREGLSGFLERRPRFYGGLERAGEVEMRDFRAMSDVHLGYRMLEQIAAVPDLFHGLFDIDIASPGFRVESAGREVRLSQILLTALVRNALDGRSAPLPLEADRLAAMRAATMMQGAPPVQLSAEFRRSVDDLLQRRLDAESNARAQSFVNSCLKILEEELGDLQPAEPIDPRFIRSILLRRD